ncbi:MULTISPECIES: LexA family protein [Xanthomarina]|uniref:Error-prone repair protein UmuD n=1 Tax=Xanthomarina gelatinilytica TaxID=1137281 RepID=M7MLP1_9FLAO|nr:MULTISPECIES: translesion error-prone DNA polymerase V autoproteolytic subunit [Xanthomarina]MCB0389006.1 translesion error-prone DNA polymerase V autoproteolytic subunit [Winogradskyella sp.]EMQ95780.1 Error-prone repair protein UmuD [Xanthomarina gelatinilytica]MAL22321.1 peptidase S24 [Xanthomarina sp.]MBF60859.1 peptidase S24 [Xanthomarina sp.]MDX1316908.1 translesion error-prone DNA polymerase V autoproteolytic subunit [Xanthomarina gelatinilytica]
MIMHKSETLTFFTPDVSNQSGAVYLDTGISAGFPSPAEDFKEERLSLDNILVKNKLATFYARVSGQSMVGAGLDDNDLLVIDRSLEPAHNRIAVCFLDGEFTVKRLRVEKDGVWLQPENENYEPIKITEENDFVIWGIVTNVIKKV